MAIVLKLREKAGELVVTFDDQTVKTALEKIPAIQNLQADPFTNGQALTAALGGVEMLKRLDTDSDNLILLDCDDTADAFAWEFATLNNRQFFCVKAGMLRTVPRNAPPAIGNSALNFIALAADPLVDHDGNVRDGYRLDLDNEMKAIRETLRNCGKNLEAKRIPPTREELYKALRKGPAILHLSCHGNVVAVKDQGPVAMLALEKNDGSIDPFLGPDLMNTKRGILRMVVLSACKTATGTDANLARALALNGVPMTIGMQGSIKDKLSDDFATALYDSLFQGFTFGEALQQARQNIARSIEDVGLPVGYVSVDGWSEAFPIQQGTPSVGGLGKPGESALGGEIQPPRPLLGRNLELHQIAKHFTSEAGGGKVLTVAGTGGMGKTALASTFAERFAWLWMRGVRAYSFANEVNAANFRYALMRALFGNEAAQQGASLSESEQREEILKAAREWSGLWLFDNYESILQELQNAEGGMQNEAESIHRLIADLANGGADLLLTSREQPAGLKNERLFPDGNHALHGLDDAAGVELFFQHSVKAKEDRRAHAGFAFNVQHAANGHPLAIALLAGEYDTSAVTSAEFLKNWEAELASAERRGLAGHHVTFTIAFERSYSHLSVDLQQALCALSIFPFPFFAQGAAVISGRLSVDSEQLSIEKQMLDELTRRSLLEVDGWYEDNTPATYRFQPALRQEAARRLDSKLKESQQIGYAAYGEWFVQLAFDEIGRQPSIARLALASLGELIKNADNQPEDKSARYCWLLGTVLHNLGFTREADEILNKGSSIAQSQGDNIRRERILFQQARLHVLHGEIDKALEYYSECAQLAKTENNEGEYSVVIHEMANIYVTRGDLDRALSLYQESLALKEQLGDKQGKAATLHQMAQVFLTRGDLDRALSLYQESLALLEQLGDKQGKAASLSNMAQVFLTRGDLDRALSLYQESLALLEQLGDKKGKAASLHQMAQVFLTRGDLDRALSLYQESTELSEQLGDKQGKAASLHQMAQVFLTRGDLDRALSLYQESTELSEQLGDKQGKAASLSNMAQVFLTRGDLDRALSLYQESLALLEQLGDKKGKAASLHQMAQVFLTRGDLDRALSLYQESTELSEQLGDKQGKGTSLSMLGNLYMMRKEYENAEKVILEFFEISKDLGHISDIAFNIVKLGQVAQARNDGQMALMRYREGLTLFEKLGAQPLVAQVKQLIASLEGGAVANDDPLAQVIAQARGASDVQSAIQYQEQAVAIAREMGNGQTLTAQLVNLAQYYGKAERHNDAVTLLEQALQVGEQSGHPQVGVIRKMLEEAKNIASLTPEEREQLRERSAESRPSANNDSQDFETQLQAQLAQLPPEQHAEAEAQIRKAYAEFQRMSPEEQAAVVAQQQRAQIENAANQVRDAGLAYVRKQAPKRDVLQMLEGASRQMKSAGSAWLDVAALCDALVALIKEETVIPSVPAAYVSHFSAVQSEVQRMNDK